MRRLAFGLCLVLGMALGGASAQQDQDLSGTTVTIFGAFTDESEVGAVNGSMAPFEEETGIDVVYEGASDFEILINARVEAGDPPDIACFPQPGLMNRFADQIVDVTSFLDREYLEGQYIPGMVDISEAYDGSGKVLGVWMRILNKSLVWYSPTMFDDFGYEVPETWDELIALSDQIVEDGGVPWSVSMESGAATGWVGTDWIEDIMLRTTSLENYDRWTVPASADERLPFQSEEVRRAWELMGEIMLNEDYVLGGTDRILGVRFFDTGVPIVEGEAFMTKMGSFMPPWLGERLEEITIAPDGDLWYFPFPSIDEEFGRPVLIAGDVCSMFNDRPEVQAVMEYLTTGESLRAGIEAGVFLSPHTDADIEWYRPQERGIAEQLLEADAVRFDGGDLMPAAVGAGTFWQGIVNYVGQTQELEDILGTIDQSWPQ
jgi:alpha-glucoside transport system substrate-binding protein